MISEKVGVFQNEILFSAMMQLVYGRSHPVGVREGIANDSSYSQFRNQADSNTHTNS